MKNYSHDKIEIILVGNKLDLKAKLFYNYKVEQSPSMKLKLSPEIMDLDISKSRPKAEKELISAL